MKLIYIPFLLVLIACSSSKKITVVKNDNAIKYANTITAKELDKHLYVLASDKYQGRETGKIGQQMTEKYLINSFKKKCY